MLDIAAELWRWWSDGHEFAVATVVATGGSAPRPPGAALAVAADGTALGSVSGGCVEGAVYELCVEVLRTSTPTRESFGYSTEDAFAVGLTCGGTVDIAVRPVRPGADPAAGLALSRAAAGEPVALATVLDGPAEMRGRCLAVTPDGHTHGSLVTGGEAEPVGDAGSPATGVSGSVDEGTVVAETRAMLDAGRTGILRTGCFTETDEDASCTSPPPTLDVFVHTVTTPPRLIVFGAIDFAAALVRAGKTLGYQVTVCDARPVFTTASRFPEADEVVVEWPHRYLARTSTDARTAVCVLTHDAKFDVPLLEAALRRPATEQLGYVGAMGSRRTHAQRLRELTERGLTNQELSALHAPIGLDLGARTPEETALSILAEIIAVRRGGSGEPLGATGGPIHHDLERPAPPTAAPPTSAPPPAAASYRPA